MEILLTNLLILAQGGAKPETGNIHIRDGKIVHVGKCPKGCKYEERIDCAGKIAFPGLVNSHTHIAMTLLRGYGEGLPLHDWLEKKIWPAEEKLSKKDVRAGTLLGIIEMVRSGTTAFNEMYVTGVDEIAKAASECGIRATVGYGMLDRVGGKSREAVLKDAEAFAKRVAKSGGIVKPAICCHAPYTCSAELIQEGKALADKLDCMFHIHVSETRKEVFDNLKETKKRPVEYLQSLGALGKNTALAHCVFVTAREIKMVAESGASVLHCPVSNMKLAGGGTCPATEFASAGANVALGTDGAASNGSLSMLETMKIFSISQKNFYWDALRAPAGQALDFATQGGANALGINAGEIAPGKGADIVLADARAPNLSPMHDAASAIAFSMHPGNITDVLVCGKFLMRDRKITFADEEKASEDAKEISRRLVG
jgi:5-methylthioadenosine/S-adenosylhomocysteine deaminase